MFCPGIILSYAFFGTFWLTDYSMKLLGVLETGIFLYFMMVHYVVIQVHKLEVIILMKIYTGNYPPPYILVDVEFCSIRISN